MLKELYTASMGMIPQQTRLEVIANNLANANTAGFKRESVFERNLIDARANFYNVAGDVEQDDPPIGSYIDFSQGVYTKTDNPLDIAVEDKGFFTLQDEAGNVFYSRSGHFKLSKEGHITAMDGKMLMGEQGPLILQGELLTQDFYTNEGKNYDLKVTETGDLFFNNNLIGSIRLADIENPNSLQKVSNQQFTATDLSEITYLPSEEITLRQGWLEGSNVDVIKEMVAMIELQRMFEAGRKVIQTNEDTLDNSIKIANYY